MARRGGIAAVILVMSGVLVSACGEPKPTAADVDTFLDTVNTRVLELGRESAQAGWVYSTYITEDTEALNARASQAFIQAVAQFAKEAAAFDDVEVAPEQRRQLELLKVALVLVTPEDPTLAGELTTIAAGLEGTYGKGTWCADPAAPDSCLDIGAITQIMATSRDEARLREVWEGWHTISVPMRDDYARFVELANTGARELGFADTGAMWRQKYDMPADEFTQELDRLWDQVRPLYESLHAYVRMKLREHYGDIVPADGPIPAHLLGNIWAQDWSNVMPLVSGGSADPGFSLTDILERRNTSAVDMVKTAERFFTSLGLRSLPETFWTRSMFVQPRDRSVVCHASAWQLDYDEDVRIKMCIRPTEEEFSVIHHELGHSYYQLSYKDLPVIFRDSANDGFHEALGDTISLSVTPEYLVQIGLLDQAPDASRDLGLLMGRALQKVAFLPFGLLIDQWRWQVFSGEITPEQYNAAWWALRLKYQGVAPSGDPRGEQFFDPGAKYHVPGNTPYTRYFLAHILQFQFHRELTKAAGCTGPLHRCSIYGSAEAGRRLDALMQMGLSKPWPEALEAMTGRPDMDATAIVDYFAPLKTWLDEQIEGRPVGW